MYTLFPSRIIFFSTFTETIYPGLRISYIILPDSLYDIYYSSYRDYSQSVSTLEQLALKRFIMEGYFESHINKLKRKYIDKRKLIIDLFKDDDFFTIDEKRNYLSILVHVNTFLSDKEIKERLQKRSIKIQLLSDFNVYKFESKTLILGYTALSKEKLIEGIEIIKSALK
jgi:GntR family transcriptional regulator/MocR family aminotransferase